MVVTARYFERKQPAFENGPKLISALQAFVGDLAARKEPIPQTVSLRELIRCGYIAPNDVHAFDGMELTISLTADETRPQEILARVRLPDGSIHVLLGDGSALQVTEEAERKQREGKMGH